MTKSEQDELKARLEDIAGELGNMADYPAIGDYQKMARRLIETSISSTLERYGDDFEVLEENIEEAISIFTEDIFNELRHLAEQIGCLSESELTYKEASEKVLELCMKFEDEMRHEIANRIKSVPVLMGCAVALRHVSDYIYDTVRL